MKKQILATAMAAVVAFSSSIGTLSLQPSISVSAFDEDAALQSAQIAVYATTIDIPLEADVYNIELSTGNVIDKGVLNEYKVNVNAGERDTVVEPRDWTIYDDEYGLNKMTEGEQAYYRRLESTAKNYISETMLDAYFVNSYQLYVTNGVTYADLGLSRQDAVDVTEWFLYNNPQYYFLKPHFLSSSSAIYVGCYPEFASGEDRAIATNEVFDVVDGWIASINDDELTAYDKLVSAHDLLCDEVTYVKGTFDQSIYSAATQKQTVCAGYADAMVLMLNASGVDTTTVISETHAWNLVKLDDGNYYAVDATWDDILGGHQLLAVGEDRICKYDSGKEHVPVEAWGKWSPELMKTAYVVQPDMTDTKSYVPDPGNVRPVYKDGEVYVKWDSVENATGYEVRIGNSSKVTSVTSTTVHLTNMREGQTIDVYVRAKADTLYSQWVLCQVCKQGSSSTSTPATQNNGTTTPPATTKPSSQTTTKPSTTTTTQPAVNKSLAAPTLHAKDITSSSMVVYWDSVDGASGYEYTVAKDSAYNNVIASNATTNRTLRISGMASDTTCYVRVRAYATVNGVKTYSPWKTGYVKTKANETVAKPTNVSAKYTSDSKVNVTWSGVSNANKYEVRVYTDSTMKTMLSSKTTILNFATMSVSNYKSVYIVLRALNSNTNCYSDWVAVSASC